MDKQEAIQHIIDLFSQHGLEPSKLLKPYKHTTVHRVPEEKDDSLALEWFDEGEVIGLRLVFLWVYGEPLRDSQFSASWQSARVQGLAGKQVEGWYLFLDEIYGDGAIHFAAIEYAQKHGLRPCGRGNRSMDCAHLIVSKPQVNMIMKDMFNYYLINRRHSHIELIGKTR